MAALWSAAIVLQAMSADETANRTAASLRKLRRRPLHLGQERGCRKAKSCSPRWPRSPRCERKVATFLCVRDSHRQVEGVPAGRVSRQKYSALAGVTAACALLLAVTVGVVLRRRCCSKNPGYGALGQLLGKDEAASELLPHEEDRVVWRVKHSRLGKRLRAHFRRRSSSTDALDDESEAHETGDEYEIFGIGSDVESPYDLHNVSSSALDADIFEKG